MDHLTSPAEPGQITLDRDLLDRAAHRLLGLMDRDHGGIRGAPKFPQATLLEFLWRSSERTGRADLRDAVLVTLRNICQGGIYDHVGGGFSRYSVDDRWLVPHFEKMLYDNAQLIELLAYAFVETGDRLFLVRIEQTVAWLEREMLLPGSAFAASLDADSEGHEGRFYVWTLGEVLEALGPEDGSYFASVYDIKRQGNWEGVSIPNRLGDAASDATENPRIATLRTRLLARRERRPRPALDDKILADWNGLLISALALAGSLLDRPDWVTRASEAYRFIRQTMSRDDRPCHAWREGVAVFPGVATDYAALVKAALALHSATANPAYLADAELLSAALRRHHWDASEPGYYLPADDAEALIVRPRSATDEATPSANSLMAQNHIRLWHQTGRDTYRADADAIIHASSAAVANNLFAVAGILNALDLRLTAADLVVVAASASDVAEMIAVIRRHWRPTSILSVHTGMVDLPPTHPASGKTAVEGRPTVYICRGEVCSLPITDPRALDLALRTGSRL